MQLDLFVEPKLALRYGNTGRRGLLGVRLVIHADREIFPRIVDRREQAHAVEGMARRRDRFERRTQPRQVGEQFAHRGADAGNDG